MRNIRNELIEAFNEGSLLQTVYKKSLEDYRENRRDLSTEIISLHNEGLIDIIKAFKFLKNYPDAKCDFFLTRDVLEKSLPRIIAPVHPVMDCIVHLVKEAGQDMAAGSIFTPFIDFCTASPNRPKEALAHIEASVEQFADLLTPVIIAGTRIDFEYYFNEAIRLSGHEDILIRRRAIFSMGRIQYPEGSNYLDSALALFELMVNKENDDQLLGNIVKSSFSLYKQRKSQEERYNSLIKSALVKGGDYALHAASELLFHHLDDLYAELLDTVFAELLRINPLNKGTINNIDYGLAELIEKGNTTIVLKFIEALLVAHSSELSFELFDSVTAELRKGQNKNVLGRILTRWFLKGDSVLCLGIYRIVNLVNEPDMILEIEPSEMDANDFKTVLFVARKTIGYLFSHPVTAASIIISMMKHSTDDEIIMNLKALLFDPLLINYSGKVKEYLTQQKDSFPEKTKMFVEDVLKELENYLNDLKSTGEIPELYSSQVQRDTYSRYFSQQISESMKKAEKDSVILSLVSKSVLLYGKKSINYIYDKSGHFNRMEMPLHSHGTEMEFPRLENIDPFGLDYLLRVFRAERIKYETHS